MPGSALETSNFSSFTSFGPALASPSFADDFSQLALEQQQEPGGAVGLTPDFLNFGDFNDVDNSDSSSQSFSSPFSASAGIMTPPPSDYSTTSLADPLSPSSLAPTISTPEPGPPETPISAQESDHSPTTRPKEFRCTYPGCKSKKKVFLLECKLRKHMRNHTRPDKCPFCTGFKGAAQFKGLARHVRAAHSDLPEARANRAYWAEEVACELCGRLMRKDNRKRHAKSCEGRGTGGRVVVVGMDGVKGVGGG
ncbi:hypothetical protein B0J18DRAFT_406391 [Chaetomium sp. MPI-SDFR-AT-0129]|nr:hypothetical protein B0J18DRAFT_406391 [Chaetomium sp. MPI-SDFR-AT-0129]